MQKKLSSLKNVRMLAALLLIPIFVLFLSAPGKCADEKEFELSISTLPAGFASYTMGVALAEQINKNSSWLNATAMEGRGPAEHMKKLVKKEDMRKNYLFFNTTWDIWEAKKGIGPYKNFPFDYDEFKFVCLLGIAGNGLATTDPEISSLQDLEGKKVIFDSAPNKGRQIVYRGVLKEAGVDADSLRYQYSAGKMAANALRDGLVDAIYTGHILKKLSNNYGNSPYLQELVSTKATYFISFKKEAVKAFKEKTNHPVTTVKVPPEMLGPKQTEPCGILIKPLGFCAHKDMPDRVINEILRVVYENADKFEDYTKLGAILTKETMASLSIPAESYHRAAVEFFNDKGIEITGFE